ncbi:MAG: regulatory protein RecX [Candidatus Obscuribacterales bacterium]|nr:regulatory protein RecX [Steroidobacteraceae bacterium]
MRRSFSRRGIKPEAADDESRIRSVALALQTYREHGAQELESKLTRKGYDAVTAAQVIEDLRESGLVSDHRFAGAFVRGHAGRGHGPIRIRHELRELGVAPELIESSLASQEVDWCELAAQVRLRKFGAAASLTYVLRAKQMRFLQYRGFSTDQIRAAFAALGNQTHEADELLEFDLND